MADEKPEVNQSANQLDVGVSDSSEPNGGKGQKERREFIQLATLGGIGLAGATLSPLKSEATQTSNQAQGYQTSNQAPTVTVVQVPPGSPLITMSSEEIQELVEQATRGLPRGSYVTNVVLQISESPLVPPAQIEPEPKPVPWWINTPIKIWSKACG